MIIPPVNTAVRGMLLRCSKTMMLNVAHRLILAQLRIIPQNGRVTSENVPKSAFVPLPLRYLTVRCWSQPFWASSLARYRLTGSPSICSRQFPFFFFLFKVFVYNRVFDFLHSDTQTAVFSASNAKRAPTIKMDNAKRPYSDKSRDSLASHSSFSLSEEHEGLVSGIPFPQKRSNRTLARLLPASLIISIILNCLQAVYIGVREPQCRSLYGIN